jgi:hypothetical protein
VQVIGTVLEVVQSVEKGRTLSVVMVVAHVVSKGGQKALISSGGKVRDHPFSEPPVPLNFEKRTIGDPLK